MKLPDEAIREFKELYEKKYGVELSLEEAQEKASEFLNLLALSKGYHHIL